MLESHAEPNRAFDYDSLPQVAYIGDVPVSSTVGGAALLYRLLCGYPTSKLRIVEGNFAVSETAARLPDIHYSSLRVGILRLLKSRFAAQYGGSLFRTVGKRVGRLRRQLGTFQPQVILTVAHGYSWLTAAAYAQQERLPLCLIIHDDPHAMLHAPPSLAATMEEAFGRVYRQATSLLCVSPFMADLYRRKYQVDAEVLYPTRAADAVAFRTPSPTTEQRTTRLTFAYAGSVVSDATRRSLRILTEVLAERGHHLSVYSNLGAAPAGLTGPNLSTHGLIPYQQMIKELRNSADVLFAPMSFEPQDRMQAEVCFPSKLTDYTAAGLPLLIWGPPYCSAVRWAHDHPGVAELVEEPAPEALLAAVERLESSSARSRLAAVAIAVGDECFSHTAGIRRFYAALQREFVPVVR